MTIKYLKVRSCGDKYHKAYKEDHLKVAVIRVLWLKVWRKPSCNSIDWKTFIYCREVDCIKSEKPIDKELMSQICTS